MRTGSYKLGIRENGGKIADLQVSLSRPAAGRRLELAPTGQDEPLYRTYNCRSLSMKHGKARGYANTGSVVVTARRAIFLLLKGPNGKGAETFTIASADREELTVAKTKTTFDGKPKSVDFATSDGGSISVAGASDQLTRLLSSLAPESVLSLGQEAAAKLRTAKAAEAERKREEERKAKEAAERAKAEKVALAAQEFQAKLGTQSRQAPVSVTVGSVFDHRKTWRYRVAAPPANCVQAFANAFSSGGGVLLRAKWNIKRTSDGAIAVYAGRKGVIAMATAMSQTATAEQDGAIGSEVKFEILGRDGDHTLCVMWLASNATRLGFVNDGRFFRPYMRAVEDQLRQIDPSVQVIKD